MEMSSKNDILYTKLITNKYNSKDSNYPAWESIIPEETHVPAHQCSRDHTMNQGINQKDEHEDEKKPDHRMVIDLVS